MTQMPVRRSRAPADYRRDRASRERRRGGGRGGPRRRGPPDSELL